MAGDQINASGSQGYINRPTGPVTQNIANYYTGILRPAPAVYRSAVMRMVEDYELVFGGREHELDRLDRFLVQDAQRTALLLAPTGRGKTALLIHWLARVRAQGEWDVVFAPISRRYQTATAEATLNAIAAGLAAVHDETAQLQTYNTAPDQVRPLVGDYLRRTPPSGRKLLLVLDGLDEAEIVASLTQVHSSIISCGSLHHSYISPVFDCSKRGPSNLAVSRFAVIW